MFLAKKIVFGLKINMNTVSQNAINNHNSPVFSGKRLCQINLKRKLNGQTTIIPAYFTRLTAEDIPLITKVEQKWKKNTTYVHLIIADFLDSVKRKFKVSESNERRLFFMIETLEKGKNIGNVRTLAEVYVKKKDFYVDYLQSLKPLKNMSKSSTVSGGGTAMLYGLSRYAEKLKAPHIRLTPSSMHTEIWYKRLGFVSMPDDYFDVFMPVEGFTDFQKYYRDNYFMKVKQCK